MDGGDSRRNEGEARAALAHVRRLVAAGIASEAIGLITPYAAQVLHLQRVPSQHPDKRSSCKQSAVHRARTAMSLCFMLMTRKLTRKVPKGFGMPLLSYWQARCSM